MSEGSGIPPLEPPPHAARLAVRAAVLVSLATSGATLVGWALGPALLGGLFRDLATMRPNGAVALALGGLALASLSASSRWQRHAGFAAASVMLLIGFATFLEYLLALDFGIDDVLFRPLENGEETANPGRMSLLSAVEAVLFAVGWFVARVGPPRARWLIQATGLSVLLASFLALCGHIYGAHELYHFAPYTQIAPHTALALALLAVGLLASQPQEGIVALLGRKDAGGVMVRRMLPASIVIPIGIGAARLWGQQEGFYGTRIGLALFACSNVVVFVWLIIRSGLALSRTDQERRQAEDAVEEVNERLERQVAEALKRGEERYRSLARNLPGAAAVMFDKELRFVMAEGAALLSKMGLSAEKLIGKTLAEVGQSGTRQVIERLYRDALEGISRNLEVSTFGLQVRLHTASIYDGSGAITHGLAFLYDMSAFAQTESVLKQSEARLRGLSEAAFEGIAFVDQGVVFDANSALATMFGRTRDQLIRCPWFELIAPEDRAAALAHVAAGRAEARESIGVRAGGEAFPIDLRARKIDHEGRTLEAIAIQDLSARRRAESARELSDQQFKRLVETLPQGITVVRDARYAYANPSMAAILGYDSPADLVGKSIWDVLHPDEVRLRTAPGSDRPVPAQPGIKLVRCLRRDGAEVLLETISLVMDVEGGAGVLSISRDVTSERRAEAAARATTTLWRAILDGAEHSIIATTPEGMIREFNPAAERMLGYRAAEVVGRVTPALIHDQVELAVRARALSSELGVTIDPGFEAFVAKARRGLPDQNEWTYVRKDGSRFPVRVSVTTLRGPDGGIDGYIGIAGDITEAKRAESELIKAKDAAERAMRARADSLARISHEIRTPMNGILGMTELALQTRLSGEQRDYLETTEASARRLLALISDILDFSKIDSGKLRLESIPFRPEECFGTALRALAVLAQRKGLDLLIEVSPDVPKGLLGDPQRLAQILTNLVGNAIKFTERGDVVVTLRAWPREDDIVDLEIEVRDSGIGIPPEKQAMIFEAFSQVDEATTRHYGGTGLGLAICAQLVELMSGQISVQSQAGVGSRFSFRVPLRLDRTSTATLPTHARIKGLRALVVDDHPLQRELVEAMLRSWGIDLVAPSASDGASKVASEPASIDGDQAVALAREARARDRAVDLIVLNAAKARVNQGALVARLRRESAVDVGVILLGGMDNAASDDANHGMGEHLLVTKPVLASALLEAIENWLAGPRPASASASTSLEPLPEPLPARTQAALRILVADDNAINRKVVNAILQKGGHRVELVEDGRRALAAIARERFDVILMDVQMPGMDGFEATRLIRESGSTVPIVALTAQAMRGDEESCLAAGMTGYLSKPIDRAALFQMLARVLEGREVEPASASLRPSREKRADERPPFDEAELLRRVDGDRVLLSEIAALFLRDAPTMLEEVKQAAAVGDAAQVERTAHGLASMLLNLAAHRASDSARWLERHARLNDLSEAPAAIAALDTEMRALAACFVREAAS